MSACSKSPGAKDADGKHMIPLEDLKLMPGDVIAVYATARDGHSEAQTDISFIQVDPFEREFSQSQQAGGGGGGGEAAEDGDQTEISKREKELIAATWKQQNDKTATPKDNAAQGQFLSDAQQKLRDQVKALFDPHAEPRHRAGQPGVHRLRSRTCRLRRRPWGPRRTS